MNQANTPDRPRAPVACSVLMPVLNEAGHIEASVEAMRRQRFDGELEFLIVDGGSTDGTEEIVRELARQDRRIRVLVNPRRVTPSGLNVALAHARGRWVARMDAHTEYPEDYLMLGVQRLRRGGTRWVSGLAIARGRGRVSRAVGLALDGPLGRGGSRKWVAHHGPGQEYDLDSGVFAGVWERSTLLEYGGWDEDWVRNQDSEMAGRFLARGESLKLIPEMAAAYAPRDSVWELARQYNGYGRYRMKTAVRHPHTMRRSHLLAPGVVATLAAALVAPRPLRRPARAGMLVYGAAIAVAGARALGQAERWTDAATVPAVLAAMHLGWGTGALFEVAGGRAPLAALAGVLGFAGPAERPASPASQVWAPSLEEALAGVTCWPRA